MVFEIRYYITEACYRNGPPAYTERIEGTRDYAIRWIQNKLKTSNYKYYDLIEIK
jgi:hypothetical protein